MAKGQVLTKSQIPKWYVKKIRNFEELSDIQARYYYERIKAEERIKSAAKKGYLYELEPALPASKITEYDIADLESIRGQVLYNPTNAERYTNLKENGEVNELNREQEAQKYLTDLIDYTEQKAEEAAQGWIELKKYKSKKNRGHISKGGEWLANNTRAAGDKIINAIQKIMSDAEKSVQVYKYYLQGEKYQATRMEIERVLAASTTATGNYSDVNAFVNEFQLQPKSIDESIKSDSLIDDNLSEEEFEE